MEDYKGLALTFGSQAPATIAHGSAFSISTCFSATDC